MGKRKPEREQGEEQEQEKDRLLKGFLLLLSLGLAVFLLRGAVIVLALGEGEPSPPRKAESGNYHVMVLLPPGDTPFLDQLLQGARKAAEDYSLGLEIQRPERMADYLTVARISRVDGVALYVTDEELLVPEINRLSVENVPVITLESDAPGSRRLCYVGSNSFHIGQQAGQLILKEQPSGVQAALIRSSRLFERASRGEVIYYGLLAALSGDENRVADSVLSDTGILSAEETARRVMLRNPGVNVIFSTSMIDTIAAVQAIRKYRPRRDIKILGYGDHKIIRQGMDQGRVIGTILRDGYTTGYEGVQTLVEAMEDQYVPSSRYIDFRVQSAEGGAP